MNVTLKLLLSDGVIEIFDKRGGGVGGPFTLLKLSVLGGAGLCFGTSLNVLLLCDVLLQSLDPLEILLTPNVKGSLMTAVVVVVGNLKVLVRPITGLDSLHEKLFDDVGLSICCVLLREKLLMVDMVSEMGDRQLTSLCSIVLSVLELKMVKPMPLLVSGDRTWELGRLLLGLAILLCQNS